VVDLMAALKKSLGASGEAGSASGERGQQAGIKAEACGSCSGIQTLSQAGLRNAGPCLETKDD
jgi:hypothetical protein